MAEVISLVERGWPGARRVAFQLKQAGIATHHLVRGRLPRELLGVLITCEGMALTDIAPRWYRWVVWWVLRQSDWRHRVVAVLVDNERAERWVTRWFPTLQANVFLVQEASDGSPILFQHSVHVQMNVLLALKTR